MALGAEHWKDNNLLRMWQCSQEGFNTCIPISGCASFQLASLCKSRCQLWFPGLTVYRGQYHFPEPFSGFSLKEVRSAKDLGLEALNFVYESECHTRLSLNCEVCSSARSITTMTFKYSFQIVCAGLFRSLFSWNGKWLLLVEKRSRFRYLNMFIYLWNNRLHKLSFLNVAIISDRQVFP